MTNKVPPSPRLRLRFCAHLNLSLVGHWSLVIGIWSLVLGHWDLVICAAWGGDEDFKVGLQPDGRIVVPTNQVLRPAGKQVTFPGRPVDLALADDGRTLVVKNMSDLVFIDTTAAAVRQTLFLSAHADLPHAFNPNTTPLNLYGKPGPGGA